MSALPLRHAVAAGAMAVLLLPGVAAATGPGTNNTYQLDNTASGTVTGFVFGGEGTAGSSSDPITSIANASSFAPANGMLDFPYYYSTTSSAYFGLTYSPPDGGIPLSFALGFGTAGSDWHQNDKLVYSQEDNGRETPVGYLKGDLGATAITTAAVSSNVVTIAATAHGYSAGDVVVISGLTGTGYENLNTVATVATVPDANSFTYALTAGDVSADAAGGAGITYAAFELTDQTIEASPGTGQHYRGTGSLTVEGSIPFSGGTTLGVKHVYTLAAGDQYVEVATTITNNSGASVSNINAWVGTSDDWIGTTDSPNKIKGDVRGSANTSSFNAACSGTTNAIIVNTDDEYVLLYSPAPGADTVLFDSYNDWNTDVLTLAPADSEFEVLDNDGSYALVLPYGTIANGAEKTLNWYYEGGQLGFTPPADCTGFAQAAYVSNLALSCTPDPVVEGAVVTCEVTGGDPGIDILWEADLGGVFATAGVTLDELGNGTFSFTAPPGSTGRSIAVRLVSWDVGDDVAVAGEAVPASLPAGGGPSGPAPALLVGALMAAVGLGLTRLRRAGAAA